MLTFGITRRGTPVSSSSSACSKQGLPQPPRGRRRDSRPKQMAFVVSTRQRAEEQQQLGRMGKWTRKPKGVLMRMSLVVS